MYNTKRILVFLTVLFLLFSLHSNARSEQSCCGYTMPSNITNSFACTTHSKGNGNCVWWAVYNRNDLNFMSHSPDDSKNPDYWVKTAKAHGYSVDTVPKEGAIAVYPSGSAWGYLGHVAYVESVSGNQYTVTEMGYNAWNCVRTRTRTAGQYNEQFIYKSGSGKPDLVVREVYLTDKRVSFLPGESFRIYTKIKNVGDADAGHEIKIKYYLSEGDGIDGNPVRLGDDTIDKEDLQKGKSGDEKIDVKAPNTPGKYNITVFADTENNVNEENESNNRYDPPLVFEVAGNINARPVGFLDIANCENIAGWAKDPDTNSPINVHFYVDGPAGKGGIFLTDIAANQYRSDVGTHGFSFATPEILKDGNLHRIYAYGIDSSGGENPLIGYGSVLCVKPTPLGSPVYRFWNNDLGSHFYTISEAEKDIVINTMPSWKYELIAWYAYPTQITGTSPVYRFWNNDFSSHFYTISEAEKDIVINTMPSWKYELIAWYLKTDHSVTNAVTLQTFSASTPTPLPPVGAFTATPLSGSSPLTVSFKDNSAGNISSREWDFGDNTTSVDINPVHTFNTDGIYTITLTVRGDDGWQTLTKENYIIVKPPYLGDAIKVLQVLVGLKPEGISVNANEKIGLERVIYILQIIAELRD